MDRIITLFSSHYSRSGCGWGDPSMLTNDLSGCDSSLFQVSFGHGRVAPTCPSYLSYGGRGDPSSLTKALSGKRSSPSWVISGHGRVAPTELSTQSFYGRGDPSM